MACSSNAENLVGLDVGVTKGQTPSSAVHCVLKWGVGSSPKWIRSSRALLRYLSFAYWDLQIHKSLCIFPFEPNARQPCECPKREIEEDSGDSLPMDMRVLL